MITCALTLLEKSRDQYAITLLATTPLHQPNGTTRLVASLDTAEIAHVFLNFGWVQLVLDGLIHTLRFITNNQH